MRIIVDESVDFHFVRLLRLLLFSVMSIAEDFGDLVFYKQLKVYAVILLRYDKAEKHFIEEKLT